MLVKRDDRFDLNGHDLIINRVVVDDGGEYSCEIEADSEYPIVITHIVEVLGTKDLRAKRPIANLVHTLSSLIGPVCLLGWLAGLTNRPKCTSLFLTGRAYHRGTSLYVQTAAIELYSGTLFESEGNVVHRHRDVPVSQN
jgi:hypothetical protein